jgi:hypothetical protein
MSKTHIIIIAAGDATRWGNHLGVPKHLIQIDGESLLERTVRLFSQEKNSKIFVVGPDDDRYRVKNTTLFTPIKNKYNHGVDKFINSSNLWNGYGRTIVVYGDVYFTEESVNTILNYKSREWKLFCSFKKGECFAQSFYDEHVGQHIQSLFILTKLCNEGLKNTGGWSHYRVMNGKRDNLVGPAIDLGMAIPIEDITNDFDYPNDYDKFMKSYKK